MQLLSTDTPVEINIRDKCWSDLMTKLEVNCLLSFWTSKSNGTESIAQGLYYVLSYIQLKSLFYFNIYLVGTVIYSHTLLLAIFLVIIYTIYRKSRNQIPRKLTALNVIPYFIIVYKNLANIMLLININWDTRLDSLVSFGV